MFCIRLPKDPVAHKLFQQTSNHIYSVICEVTWAKSSACLFQVHGELKRVWYRHKYQKGDTAAFTRSFAATSYRRSLTASTSRCHSPAPVPQVPMKDFRQEGRLKSTHSSSQELVRYPELLTAAEKRNLRLHKAHSHDLEQHPGHNGERVGNGLLKRAIKGSAAQNSCQRKQSNTDSVSSDERLLLTLT